MRHFLNRHKRIFLISASFVFLSVLFASFSGRDFLLSKNLDIYVSLIRELNVFYVEEIDPDKMLNSSIEGLLSDLDPYTSFIPESERESFATMTTGRYGGIGSLIRQSGDYVMIADPYENSPADKSGLKAGDLIMEIDQVSIKGKPVSSISELLKGAPLSTLKLTILRPSISDTLNISVIREEIKIRNVPYYGMIDEVTGYIRLSGFTEDAGREVSSALKDLKDNQEATSVILDVRGNPGGLLIEAVNVSNLFLDKGLEIVSTRGRVKQWDNVFKGRNQPMDTEIPLIVLVNRGSASASEIVAGAIQDYDRGLVLGQRSFGKGLIQTTRPLSFNAQLKVTTAKYHTPSGRCIQALDFIHRNEDGSVGYIPDSLITEFKTRNGRTVYDGGGIIPDISIEHPPLSRISASLYLKNLIFDYATIYSSQLSEKPNPLEFSISEEDYQDFFRFLEGKSFDYQTESEELLNELIKVAKTERYYSLAEPEFNALSQKLAHDSEKDLYTFREEITGLINEEIIGRFYYQGGKIRYSLLSDPLISEARRLLKDKPRFESLLGIHN